MRWLPPRLHVSRTSRLRLWSLVASSGVDRPTHMDWTTTPHAFVAAYGTAEARTGCCSFLGHQGLAPSASKKTNSLTLTRTLCESFLRIGAS